MLEWENICENNLTSTNSSLFKCIQVGFLEQCLSVGFLYWLENVIQWCLENLAYFQQIAEKFLKFQNWTFLSEAQFLKLQKHGVCYLSFYSVFFFFSKPFQRSPLKEEELLRPVVWLWFIRLAASALPHPKTTESDFLGVVTRNVLTSSPDDFYVTVWETQTNNWVSLLLHSLWSLLIPNITLL